MPGLQNRTRTVYVRVSDDKLRSFRELRRVSGARNISDLVRSAVKTMESRHGSSFESEVTYRLTRLESSLELLAKTMEKITAAGTRE